MIDIGTELVDSIPSFLLHMIIDINTAINNMVNNTDFLFTIRANLCTVSMIRVTLNYHIIIIYNVLLVATTHARDSLVSAAIGEASTRRIFYHTKKCFFWAMNKHFNQTFLSSHPLPRHWDRVLPSQPESRHHPADLYGILLLLRCALSSHDDAETMGP